MLVEELERHARDFYKDGKYIKSYNLYLQLTKNNRNNPKYYYWLALNCSKISKDRYQEADINYNKAIYLSDGQNIKYVSEYQKNPKH